MTNSENLGMIILEGTDRVKNEDINYNTNKIDTTVYDLQNESNKNKKAYKLLKYDGYETYESSCVRAPKGSSNSATLSSSNQSQTYKFWNGTSYFETYDSKRMSLSYYATTYYNVSSFECLTDSGKASFRLYYGEGISGQYMTLYTAGANIIFNLMAGPSSTGAGVNLVIEKSTNGSSWSSYDTVSLSSSSVQRKIEYSSTTYEYLRFTITGNGSSYYADITLDFLQIYDKITSVGYKFLYGDSFDESMHLKLQTNQNYSSNATFSGTCDTLKDGTTPTFSGTVYGQTSSQALNTFFARDDTNPASTSAINLRANYSNGITINLGGTHEYALDYRIGSKSRTGNLKIYEKLDDDSEWVYTDNDETTSLDLRVTGKAKYVKVVAEGTDLRVSLQYLYFSNVNSFVNQDIGKYDILNVKFPLYYKDDNMDDYEYYDEYYYDYRDNEYYVGGTSINGIYIYNMQGIKPGKTLALNAKFFNYYNGSSIQTYTYLVKDNYYEYTVPYDAKYIEFDFAYAMGIDYGLDLDYGGRYLVEIIYLDEDSSFPYNNKTLAYEVAMPARYTAPNVSPNTGKAISVNNSTPTDPDGHDVSNLKCILDAYTHTMILEKGINDSRIINAGSKIIVKQINN